MFLLLVVGKSSDLKPQAKHNYFGFQPEICEPCSNDLRHSIHDFLTLASIPQGLKPELSSLRFARRMHSFIGATGRRSRARHLRAASQPASTPASQRRPASQPASQPTQTYKNRWASIIWMNRRESRRYATIVFESRYVTKFGNPLLHIVIENKPKWNSKIECQIQRLIQRCVFDLLLYFYCIFTVNYASQAKIQRSKFKD